MKPEKPTTQELEMPHGRPWEERAEGRSDEELSRMKKRAIEVDALNQTLERLRTIQ